MVTEFTRALRFVAIAMALIGTYHAGLWGVGRVAFPAQTEGSLLRDAAGHAIGSSLIAQKFERPEYFQPRPSGVDYNAASTGGTNYGPSNPDHLAAVQARVDALVAQEGVPASAIPSEMVTASGAGLDPHLPPAAAEVQVRRVAAARQVAPERVRDLIGAHTDPPALGFLGRSRVNVLELNLALDAAFPVASAPR